MENIKNATELNELLNQNKPVLLDFYADWCGPCQALLPIVEDLANEYQEDLIVKKVNVDDSSELASMFQVRSIPALFFLKGNEIIDQSKGLVSKALLKGKIDQAIKRNAA